MKQQHSLLSSTQPYCSFTISESQKTLVTTHLTTVASFGMPFSSFVTCTLNDHLAMNAIIIKITELEVQSVCHVHVLG